MTTKIDQVTSDACWAATKELQHAIETLQGISYSTEQTGDGLMLHALPLMTLLDPVMRSLCKTQRELIRLADREAS